MLGRVEQRRPADPLDVRRPGPGAQQVLLVDLVLHEPLVQVERAARPLREEAAVRALEVILPEREVVDARRVERVRLRDPERQKRDEQRHERARDQAGPGLSGRLGLRPLWIEVVLDQRPERRPGPDACREPDDRHHRDHRQLGRGSEPDHQAGECIVRPASVLDDADREEERACAEERRERVDDEEVRVLDRERRERVEQRREQSGPATEQLAPDQKREHHAADVGHATEESRNDRDGVVTGAIAEPERACQVACDLRREDGRRAVDEAVRVAVVGVERR